MENIARKFRLQINQEKTKYMIVERKNSLKKNKIGHLKIKKTCEQVDNFKYLGVILNEDNNNQIDLQERIKNDNKTYFMLQQLFKNKNMSKKLKLRLKNTTDRQTDRQAEG
jgi:hypothetical protein